MKLGPIKAELNEVYRSIYQYIQTIISKILSSFSKVLYPEEYKN
jgi:hypothetical protein